jgi:hypothetical protein
VGVDLEELETDREVRVVVLVVGAGDVLVVVRIRFLFLLGTLFLLGDVRSFNLLTRCAMYSLVNWGNCVLDPDKHDTIIITNVLINNNRRLRSIEK